MLEQELAVLKKVKNVEVRFSSLAKDLSLSPFYIEALTAFDFSRLNGVKAVSYLIRRSYPDFAYDEGLHTKLDHSLKTAIITEEILRINNATEEQIQKGIVGALLHDIGHPAFADAAQKINKKELKEEDHWQDQVGEKGWNFLKKNGIDPKGLDETVHGKGIIGKVLDIADRIAYVTEDSHAIDHSEGQFGEIFKTVGVDWESEQVYFTDHTLLSCFLLKRFFMFREFYTSPETQGTDLLIAKMINDIYKNYPRILRKRTDDQLTRTLEKHFRELIKPGFFEGKEFFEWRPQYKSFASEEEALKHANKILEEDNYLIGVEKGYKFDPGTKYLCKGKSGKIFEFQKFPNPVTNLLTITLNDYEKSLDRYFVFYSEKGRQSDEVENLLSYFHQKK